MKEKKCFGTAQSKFALPEEELQTYFDEYTRSTNALADAVVQVADGELQFDNKGIAEYTKDNYSQEIIRDKLLRIFDDAEQIHEGKKKSKNLDD